MSEARALVAALARVCARSPRRSPRPATTVAVLALAALAGLAVAAPASAYPDVDDASVELAPIATIAPTVMYLDLAGGGHCSAFYVGGDEIVTAAHCVDRKLIDTVRGSVVHLSASFTVLDDDSVELGTTKTVVAYSADDDVAVLRLAAPLNAEPAAIDCAAVTIGQDVSVAGYPGSLGYTATFGKIAGVPRRVEWWTAVFSIDAKADAGNSGGPVFDAKTGKVVGILVGGTMPAHQIYMLAVPAAALCRLLGIT